jgi:hypothetical protein
MQMWCTRHQLNHHSLSRIDRVSLIPPEIIVHFSITLSSQELRSGIELGFFRIFLLLLMRRIALFPGVLLFLFTSTFDCRYLLFSCLVYC